MPIVTLDISEEGEIELEVEFGVARSSAYGFGANVQILSDQTTIEMSYEQAESLYSKFKPYFEAEVPKVPWRMEQPMRTVPFTIDDAEAASDEWNFNCGPAALCAVLNRTPAELRPHLLDFEQKGYTNPSLMFSILKKLGVQHRQTYRGDNLTPDPMPHVEYGLVRVQWGGPWTRLGVPMAARYRQTHWIAMAGAEVFDVNAMCVGGWLPYAEWADQLVPWLIRECVPKGDGTWWQTHVIEVAQQ